MKSWLKTGVLGAVAALGIVAASAQSASAYIVCNRFHECWHSRTRYAYPARLGITFYADTWRAPGVGWRWVRDRDDRGYYYHGVWRRF
jgi:hypothetical protein